ncbi:putative ABC transporter, permease protein [Clostridium bornimense]|uniref:Putative ABC transporter, permease protein n=1 Tax=Clostridium bornimense TaxID=1216932 RepID=W6RZW1_9CLOT|nr:ABC transporter permease [Clostridium bornimense]CDM70196.1 putative ABC transporter, permease protein [Clostridium bornimense]
MKSYSDISIRYMKENKKRTTLTIIGIALATILIFAIGTFLLSLRDSMIASERASGDFEFMLKDITGEEADKVINNVEVKNSSITKSDSMIYKIEGKDFDILIDYGNGGFYKRIYKETLVEGELPSNTDEIVINTMAKEKLNIKLGDKITLKDENNIDITRTVVGIKKINGYNNGNELDFDGYLNKIDKSKNYNVYVNLNSASKKQDIISKVIKDANITLKDETKNDNSKLLYLTGNGGSEAIDRGIKNVAIFIISIVILCTITVIYNSFNMSIIERIRYFGILKAIGATNKQIKRIVYREGFLMGLIALPIGSIIGFFSLKFGVKIFLGDELMLTKLSIKFYPIIIIFTAILVAITILLSLLVPVRKVKKISAVDAMKNKSEIKLGKIKRRKTRIIGKVFGIEGSMAYKNIRRTPMRFVVTLIALTISIVLFNVFYSFMDFARQAIKGEFMNVAYDSVLSKSGDRDFNDEEIKSIENNIKYSKIYEVYYQVESLLAPKDNIIEDKKNSGDVFSQYGYSQINIETYTCHDENEFDLAKKYVIEGKIDYDKLKDNGIVLVDGMSTRDENGDKKILRKTNYKVGDKIKLSKLPEENFTKESVEKSVKENSIEYTIVAILNQNPFTGTYPGYGIQIFSLKDADINSLIFKFDNDKNREDAIKYFDMNNNSDYQYVDLGSQVEEINRIYGQIEFFVYCFIIIITIISVVNIFNTISTNLLLRKKEFATMKAMGMTERQLKKTVMLEGTLYGIIASIVGGILSAILSQMMINSGSAIADTKYQFPYIVFTLSILVAILVTYISTLVPLRRLKKLTIVEGISDDE